MTTLHQGGPKMNCLIVGGSSGLGLNLAQKLSLTHKVFVTGRRDPRQEGIEFIKLDLSAAPDLLERIREVVRDLPEIDLLVYAAGFFQEGTITDLTESQMQEMISVGLIAPMYVSREVLLKQDTLGGLITITSTSQWTPRLLEPVYTAVKSGLGAFSNSLSLDPRVKKTLVAGPAGMDTRFWEGTGKDTSDMLDPSWVADQILELYDGNFSYKYARILRGPQRVEVQETRE